MTALPSEPLENCPPHILAVRPGNVPHALRDRAQCVVWQLVWKNNEWAKVPINVRTGKRAKPNDPATWSSYDLALAAYLSSPDRFAGIGFVFSADDPYAGIDLDDCVVNGTINEVAKRIIDELDSYAELSPTGTGVKIIIEGTKPSWARCKSGAIDGIGQVEVYDRLRYFTVTGHHVPGTPLSIEPRQEALEHLCTRLWKAKKPPKLRLVGSTEGFCGSDDELIEAASKAKNGDKFQRLFAGDTSMHGGDDSAADLALCSMLAFWTGKDAARMDALFRRSGLHRQKWNEHRGDRTYGALTIQAAIESCKQVFEAKRKRASSVGAEPDLPCDVYPLGEIDPDTGRLILSPQRTMPTAVAYIRDFRSHPGGRTLHTYAGVCFEWKGNCYREIEDGALRHQVMPWLHASVRPVTKRNGDQVLDDFNDNPGTVNAAVETVRTYTHIPATLEAPCWLNDEYDIPADELLSCKTVNVHIPTSAILPATPALFTFNALDFDFEQEPEAPEGWIKFLEQLFGDDLQSVELLQEWFGYTLTTDTSQQKMLLLVGPRRSGKGTIGRVHRRLVGPANVVGPTIGSLAQNFGLQPLIGKSLAIVSDARFTGDKIATVVERLLCISGEDTITIDRKYKVPVSLKLPTRFMFLTNELPDFSDASNALAGRFLVLRLTTTFYDREDTQLLGKLLLELPGILKWSLEGWKRLRARGHFVQPESARSAIFDLEDLSSPVAAFVRECCTVAVGHRIPVNELYVAWKHWCEQDGRTTTTSKQVFGKDLGAAASGVVRRRGNEPFYEGISLKGANR